MNKPINIWMLGFYIGQVCVEHPIHGKYILDGYYSKGVMARRNLTGNPEGEEYEMFGFDEIQFIFKPTSHSLLNRFSDSLNFIKKKTNEGCWIGDQKEFGKSIIMVKP